MLVEGAASPRALAEFLGFVTSASGPRNGLDFTGGTSFFTICAFRRLDIAAQTTAGRLSSDRPSRLGGVLQEVLRADRSSAGASDIMESPEESVPTALLVVQELMRALLGHRGSPRKRKPAFVVGSRR